MPSSYEVKTKYESFCGLNQREEGLWGWFWFWFWFCRVDSGEDFRGLGKRTEQ